MNFLEICQKTFDFADGAPYRIETIRQGPDSDIDEHVMKIIRFVQQAYTNIQLWNPHYSFLHTSGTLITSEDDGTTDYTVANVRAILTYSLKARVQGETAVWPMNWLDYKDWIDYHNLSQFQDGPPVWITRLPNRQFRLTPGPDQVYEILGDWYVTRDVLEDDEDEPLWEEDLHDIVVYHALELYTAEFEVPENTAALISTQMPRLKNEFNRRYIPEFAVVGEFA